MSDITVTVVGGSGSNVTATSGSSFEVSASTGASFNVSTGTVVGPLPQLQIAAGTGISIDPSGGVSTISANLSELSIPANLADLTDVSAGATSGQVLSYNGTEWGGLTLAIPTNLADLSNVNGTPTTGQVLAWNGTSWAPADDQTGGSSNVANLADLADVSIAAPATGQALVWSGSEWAGGNIPPGTTVNGLSGAVNLVSGDNVSITAEGQNLTIASVGGGDGVTAVNGLTGSLTLAAGDGVTIANSGSTITLNATADLTGYATETYVDSAVANLVNGSPAALDTLAELANALNNDSDFAANVTTLIAQKADANHAHEIANVTGLQAALDDKAATASLATVATSGNYSDLSGIPSQFTPAAHAHEIANVTGLQAALDGKAAVDHSHVKSDIADLTTGDLDMQGNRVLFANYYATQGDFPDPAVYHGMVAHSHADGAFYGAHAGSWVRLANQNEIPAATTVNTLTGDITLVGGDNINVTTSGQNITINGQQAGIVWSTPPQNGSSPGNAGDIAYDDNFLYLRTSQAWRQVALSPIATNITISQQPSNQSVGDGDTATFTVLATAGGETLSYQWEQSADDGSTFADISGATSNSLTVTANLSLDGYQYRASLSAPGAADVTTSVATLTVAETFDILAENGDRLMTEGGDSLDHDGDGATLTITSQPQNTTASGGEASFAVSATVSDGSALTYQWEEERLAGGGETWVQRTMPASGYWQRVTYGNGTFVAVAAGSSIAATSPDGINWTQRALPASATWRSVAYGDDTFVAVAEGTNIAATSPDGINWTQRTLPASANWYEVTYGNGTFVAVAYDSSIAATSTDGISWTQRTMPASGYWYVVTYGDGTFVAVAAFTDIAATSPDGINWTQRTLPASANWNGVAYGNGTFVAVASGNNIAATSPDGINWTQRTLPASASWYGVTYGDGTFVAAAYNSNIAATSPDGITWTQRTMPVASTWRSVTYGNGTFVAVASGSNIAATSTSTPTLQFLPLSGETASTLNLTGLTAADDGERYRVVVDSPSVEPVTSDAATLSVPVELTITSQPQNTTAAGGEASFAVSATVNDGSALAYQWEEERLASDGATWVQRTMPATTNWDSVAYGNGTFVAVASNSNIAATSTDGVTWTQRTMPATAYWDIVAYGDGTFVAMATGSNIAATSTDGVTWTQRTMPATANWDSVAYGDGTFVAVANGSDIAATSTDGVTWTQRTMPAWAYWDSVAYGNGTFVAVASGNNSNIAATSPDGITWTQRALPASGYWFSVTYGNGTFVAVAAGSNIAATSPDGITWTQRTMPATENWYIVAYGDGTFVAVVYSSNIAATSTDGVTWTQRTMPATANWYSVTYGNGTFVAVPFNNNIAATSESTLQFLPLSGETASTLNLTGLTTADDGERYRVVVDSPSVEPVTSDVATLTTPQFLTITSQPQNTTAIDGNATFTSLAEMSDGTAVTYQWQELIGGNWTDIAGESSQNLTLTGLVASDDGEQYRVVADGDRADPVISNVATLTTPQVVSFTTQPQNTTAIDGNATFTSLAEMSDGTAVTYQWQELISGNWTDIAGETSQNLALTGLLTSDNGEQYRVVANGDRADPVTSNVATLSVDFTAIAGAAYAGGWNYFGQLGRGDFENIELLDLIDGTSSTDRPEGGQLYTSGWDLYGQRGDS